MRKEQWLYGINPVLEAIMAGGKIKSIHISHGRQRKVSKIINEAEKAGLPIKIEEKDFFSKTFPKGHQGVAARILQKEYIDLEELLKMPARKNEKAFFVLLDCIEDPRNLGAILRTAEAGGVHGIILQSHRSAGLVPAVYRASAGAVEYVPLARVSNLKYAIDVLRDEGVWIYGADIDGKDALWDADFTRPAAIVLGSEGKGLRRIVRQRCDYILRIPLRGRVTSLNVSVAAGILIFEILRQRQEKQQNLVF